MVKVRDKQTRKKQRVACGGHHSDEGLLGSDAVEDEADAAFAAEYEPVECPVGRSVDEEVTDVDERGMD